MVVASSAFHILSFALTCALLPIFFTLRLVPALAADYIAVLPLLVLFLQDIRRLLTPDAPSVRAELYNLNIYGPEGFFKSHVDTPHGNTMFGSLVICLPTDFTGIGRLIYATLQRHVGGW